MKDLLKCDFMTYLLSWEVQLCDHYNVSLLSIDTWLQSIDEKVRITDDLRTQNAMTRSYMRHYIQFSSFLGVLMWQEEKTKLFYS